MVEETFPSGRPLEEVVDVALERVLQSLLVIVVRIPGIWSLGGAKRGKRDVRFNAGVAYKKAKYWS